jgi:hypothetical protein
MESRRRFELSTMREHITYLPRLSLHLHLRGSLRVRCIHRNLAHKPFKLRPQNPRAHTDQLLRVARES